MGSQRQTKQQQQNRGITKNQASLLETAGNSEYIASILEQTCPISGEMGFA